MKNVLALFGVSMTDPDFNKKLTKAYKALLLRYHPDKNKSPDAIQRFQEIREAYEKLKKDHDLFIKEYDQSGMKKKMLKIAKNSYRCSETMCWVIRLENKRLEGIPGIFKIKSRFAKRVEQIVRGFSYEDYDTKLLELCISVASGTLNLYSDDRDRKYYYNVVKKMFDRTSFDIAEKALKWFGKMSLDSFTIRQIAEHVNRTDIIEAVDNLAKLFRVDLDNFEHEKAKLQVIPILPIENQTKKEDLSVVSHQAGTNEKKPPAIATYFFWESFNACLQRYSPHHFVDAIKTLAEGNAFDMENLQALTLTSNCRDHAKIFVYFWPYVEELGRKAIHDLVRIDNPFVVNSFLQAFKNAGFLNLENAQTIVHGINNGINLTLPEVEAIDTNDREAVWRLFQNTFQTTLPALQLTQNDTETDFSEEEQKRRTNAARKIQQKFRDYLSNRHTYWKSSENQADKGRKKLSSEPENTKSYKLGQKAGATS